MEKPETKKEEREIMNEFVEELVYLKNSFIIFVKEVTSLEDCTLSLRALIEIYVIMKITWILNYKVTLLLLTNLIMFYGPLEGYCPHFLFKAKMTVIQVVEGIIGIIICLIPKYEEENEKK